MPFNRADMQNPILDQPFSWKPQKMTYLGLQIPSEITKTYQLNYTPLLKKVGEELDRWRDLPISLIGRVNCVKMNILPKFLYLFQTLPFPIPKVLFKQLNRKVFSFLWKGKPPRVKLSTLCKPHSEGGLTLPDFQLYYWASQLKAVWVWQDTTTTSSPSWRQIEEECLTPATWANIRYRCQPKALLGLINNPFIKNTLNIWIEVCKQTEGLKSIYEQTPFYNNPILSKALRDGITFSWFNKGIKTFGNLYKEGELLSFQQLASHFQIPQTHFFKYLQVRHYMATQQGGRIQPMSKPITDKLWLERKGVKGFISYMYSGLQALLGNDEPLKVCMKWHDDLGLIFEDEKWGKLFIDAQRLSFNTRHKLMQFNILHRVYFTPERLYKINSKYSKFCPRCKTGVGTLMHMFLSCPELSDYWKNIIQILSQVTNMTVPLDPSLILLGDDSVLPVNICSKTRFIKLAVIAANKCTAIIWKSVTPPSKQMWLKERSSYIPSEKITYNLRNKPFEFTDVWGDFQQFLETSP
uniref:Reverse transcriptase zinc-binding domain-containing protein n=1 Tax=Hucho hucho TaxID=62062 RepID=A0A4W5KEM2_9TELE